MTGLIDTGERSEQKRESWIREYFVRINGFIRKILHLVVSSWLGLDRYENTSINII